MSSRCAIAAWLECFQEKQSWCRNEQVCQGRISVTSFERSNGLDTALYKNIPFLRKQLGDRPEEFQMDGQKKLTYREQQEGTITAVLI